MIGPTNGGNTPSATAIASRYGSSMRRRASLYTHQMDANQNTTRKKSVRFLRSAQTGESKKSPTDPKTSPSSAGFVWRSRIRVTSPSLVTLKKHLPDDPARAERERHDREEHDRGEREDAHPLADASHGRCRRSAAARAERR